MYQFNSVYGKRKTLYVVKDICLLTCGVCEKDFAAKVNKKLNLPEYICPKCGARNQFAIFWTEDLDTR